MIDLQINGFYTKDFSCNFWQTPDNTQINALCKYLYKEGIKEFLATLITDSYESAENNLGRIYSYKKSFNENKEQAWADKRAHILGVHQEGGMISRMGVHPRQYAQALASSEANTLIGLYPGLIKLWTLCPLADKDARLTKLLQDRGVVVSYGHSNASFLHAMECFDKYKVRLVTHWGNAMKVIEGFHQRGTSEQELNLLAALDPKKTSPDLLGLGFAAYYRDDIYCMAIAGSPSNHDLHLEPNLLKKLAEKKKNKLILVSDMVCYENFAQAPSKLVGGLKSLRIHAQNAIKAGIPVNQVVEATESNPLRVLGL